MKLLAIYDITSDRLRGEAAEICKDFGLRRIQYSCFAGDLSKNRKEMLEIRLRRLLERREAKPSDAIYVLPLCAEYFRHKVLLGRQTGFPARRIDVLEIL